MVTKIIKIEFSDFSETIVNNDKFSFTEIRENCLKIFLAKPLLCHSDQALPFLQHPQRAYRQPKLIGTIFLIPQCHRSGWSLRARAWNFFVISFSLGRCTTSSNPRVIRACFNSGPTAIVEGDTWTLYYDLDFMGFLDFYFCFVVMCVFMWFSYVNKELP